MPARRNILLYRNHLLALSESFITNQARALTRYVPVLVGTKIVDPSAIAGFAAEALDETGGSDMAGDLSLKVFRHPRAAWLQRLARHEPALLHAHFGTDGYFAAPIARRLRIPLIVTFHGFDITIRRTASPGHFAFALLRPQVFREANRIVAVSSFVRERLLEAGAPAGKVVVHYMGVDMTRFVADPAVAREPVVLFVGRLVEKKGCGYLLDAMARLRSAGVAARTVIIGDGPLRAALEATARSAGIEAEFLGALPPAEVVAWMNRASVFCVPSVTAESGDSEGLPTVYVEAQAMALPCVGTLHNGIPEAVANGTTGFLVPERDVAGLADRIARLLSDRQLWTSMSLRARDHVSRDFDAREQAHALEAIYDEACGESALA